MNDGVLAIDALNETGKKMYLCQVELCFLRTDFALFEKYANVWF